MRLPRATPVLVLLVLIPAFVPTANAAPEVTCTPVLGETCSFACPTWGPVTVWLLAPGSATLTCDYGNGDVETESFECLTPCGYTFYYFKAVPGAGSFTPTTAGALISYK